MPAITPCQQRARPQPKRLSIDELREVFSYDPLTGVFHWASVMKAGKEAGCVDHLGYLVLTVHRVRYKAHRVAFAFMHGRWPVGIVDHVNGCALDNSAFNIREVTPQQNRQNQRRARSDSKTGIQGVVNAPGNRFAAVLKSGGKRRRIGTFDTAQAAHEAYCAAKRAAHPFFAG